jgi:hypothetical protein
MQQGLAERIASSDNGYVIQANGLSILRELSHEEWVVLGRSLRTRLEGSTWAIGDWLVYGGGRTTGGGSRWTGNSYKRAAEITGYHQAHLSNLYNVSVTFPPDYHTRGIVSWSCHRETLRAIPELRGEILNLASSKKWSHADVREHLNQTLVVRTQAERTRKIQGRDPRAYYTPVRVKCPQCEHTFPIKGNKVKLSKVETKKG